MIKSYTLLNDGWAAPGLPIVEPQNSEPSTPAPDGWESPGRPSVYPVTPPSEPVEFGHGKDLPALSIDAEAVVGAQGTLSPMSGGTFSGTQVIENREINGGVNIASGARITFKNCRIIGSYGASGSGYTIKCTAGGGSWLTLEDSTVITRTGAGGNTTLTKSLVSYGDCNVEVRRSLFRGGVDSMYLGLEGEGLIPTGDPLVPMARALIEDSWIGEGERAPGAHADLIQIDGVDRGYIVVRGTRFMGYSLPQGSDTLTTRITDPETATMHSACFIVTFNSQGGTITRADSHHIALRNNWFEGGNWVTDLGVSISPIEVTGNRYGLRCNFGMLKGEGISVKEDNRYGLSGETKRGGNVVTVSAGDLV